MRNEGTDPDADLTRSVEPSGVLPDLERAPSDEFTSTRYAVLEFIGRGGMGEVVRAYDPKLKREVALKRVRARGSDDGGERRLEREAQAMARLSHPNVVAVYDVEAEDGRVLVAMEYVAGGTLTEWLQTQRTWSEIVDAFAQAGRGLAAAHAVDMVHRDFKPANVLVAPGDGGAADPIFKVTDFGLAKGVAQFPEGTRTAVNIDLTQADTVLGTPRYMPPEQHSGAALDARSDLYAYCAAMWSALNNTPAFAGKDLEELLAAKLAGPPPWPKSSAVPTAIIAAIERGLQPRIEDRWPSMNALLLALAPQAPSRKRWPVAVLVGGVAVAATLSWLNGRSDALCSGARSEIAEVWGDVPRDAAARTIVGSGLYYAEATWERVERRLDEYAERWVQGHTDACTATSVRGEQSEQLMDLRMRCLGRAKIEMAATVEMLRDADAAAVQNAVALVHQLPDLGACDDTERLGRSDPLPNDPDARQRIEAAQAELARGRALEGAGRYAEALVLAEGVEASIDAVDHAPVTVEMHMLFGEVFESIGRRQDAEGRFRLALMAGLRTGNQRRVAVSLAALIHTVSLERAGFDEVSWFRDMMMALVQAEADPWIEGLARASSGAAYEAQGRFEAAEREERLALELFSGARPGRQFNIASVRNSLATALRNQGKLEDAEQEARRAIAEYAELLGDQHPMTAGAFNSLGTILASRGEHVQAEAAFRRAVDGLTAALGPDSPRLIPARGNLGNSLLGQARLDEAARVYQDNLEHVKREYGPDHHEVGSAWMAIATVALERRDGVAAEAAMRRALPILTAVLTGEHPNVAIAHTNLGTALMVQQRFEEALAAHEKATEIATAAAVPEGHPMMYALRTNLGDVLVLLGRFADARPPLMANHEVAEPEDIPPETRGRSTFLLAQAQLGLGESRTDALSLADAAAQLYARVGSVADSEIAEIRRWIDEHR